MRNLLLVFCLYLSLSVDAQNLRLSNHAEIHVLTCGPYIGELYSAFGHSAIRIYDPANRLDLIYNYGVFDFDQPNFYLNFARGNLHYKLAVQQYRDFTNYYIYFNRFIHEQRLNLTSDQKQKVFDFLQWNALPENQYYTYNYFYDNCATRVRDAFVTALGDDIVYDLDDVKGDNTIRELTDLYLDAYPWGDLAIDLCLGVPMDKTATSWMHMFLPDYVERGFEAAQICQGDSLAYLVEEHIVTYASKPVEDNVLPFFTPSFIFWIFFVIILAVTIWQISVSRRGKWLDFVLFFTLGLLGVFFLLLWLATNHEAATHNMNILWALPLHVIVAFWLVKNPMPRWVSAYFGIYAILILLLLIFWSFLPQQLHYSLIPICMVLLLRAGKIYFFPQDLSSGRPSLI